MSPGTVFPDRNRGIPASTGRSANRVLPVSCKCSLRRGGRSPLDRFALRRQAPSVPKPWAFRRSSSRSSVPIVAVIAAACLNCLDSFLQHRRNGSRPLDRFHASKFEWLFREAEPGPSTRSFSYSLLADRLDSLFNSEAFQAKFMMRNLVYRTCRRSIGTRAGEAGRGTRGV